ncbi:hypothetical protein BBO99_00001230 [Phytophthora kernoviae]|uniref:LTD domain-containing protein n=2 Tax=Phytophthora kernoviae TaxID=325452 RepID=A0A3R7JBE9_9STRA|nr:hypothetical protein G195_005364 [Phytophthora kernoviae 00238/432]KAG2525220.1 hypothetical protein JM16_004557 [Phytophthora kernoviae]RLN14864.1 hypothetical protein BBI17_004637 [Phytophthora kernoviae]RLN84558.1 hypothetical protein BBO99_00001230 [Phytophthora kernoviae]
MSYPLLRRLSLRSLDRQVARASMQICHKIVMQQLYISRVDVNKQWVVVSNPSDESVDLTGFSLSCSGCVGVFHFPTKYTLLAGDEVTVWCSPGGLKLDVDNLLQPYLFWTKSDGSLRHKSSFTSGQVNEVLLLDPLLVEVASIRVAADGRKEFRVLHCKSAHPRTVRSGFGPHLRHKVIALVLMMLACDVIARRLMLCVKSGLLVTISSFTSVVLDRLAVVALYCALQHLYPALESSFQYMLTLDLAVGCVNAAAVHVRFLEARRDWHPLFKQFARWDHRSRGIICACGIGRELLLHLLLLLPFSNYPSPVWKTVGYLLVPLFTVASGVDFLRAVATLLHMIKHPITQAVAQWRYIQKHPQYEEEDDDDRTHEEGEKVIFQARSRKPDPPLVFFTPKSLRSRSQYPYS